MREMARWGALPLLAAPMSTWGLGLGEIELQSALNQPLEAQIRLSATAEELDGLDVSLADAATFERYGLERPAFLSSLQFEVGRNDAGNEVVFVRSARSIGEPFVTVLIEATWPRGRSLREYTMLLDPPVFVPGPAQTDPVRVAESGESSSESGASSSAGGAIARQPAAPSSEPAPQSGASESASQPAAASRVGADGNYGPVQRAETLWGIANTLSGNGVTTNQMMVALYEANPAAFDGNMNWLQRGAVLRVPDRADVAAIAANNATAEVQRQTAAWQDGAQTADAQADGTQNGAQASSAQAAGGQGGERQARLRLVPPSEEEAAAAPASQAAEGSGESAGAQGEGEAVAELQSQLSSLEAELQESRRLIELRDEQLSALQQQLSEATAAAEAPAGAAASAPPAAADPGVDLESEQLFVDEPAEDPAEPAEDPAGAAPEETSAEAEPEPAPAASATQVVTAAEEPSFLSRMLSLLATPMVLIGAGVGALLLTALLYLRRRRDDVEDVTGRWEALEAEIDAEAVDRETTERLRRQSREGDFIVEESHAAPEPAAAVSNAPDFESAFETPDVDDEPEPRADATGRFQAPDALTDDTLSSQSVINLDQADPVAEADFHMAYGLYDQAADLVSKALEQDPSSRPLKLKLLEVYFVWGNKEAFLDAAKDLRAEMGDRADSDWDKVIIMGKQICPDESLFADATAAAGEVDVDLDAGDGGLDFAFGGDDGAGVDLDLGGPGESDVDLALEATGESGAMDDRLGSTRRSDSNDPNFDELTSDEPAARAPASSPHVLDDTLDIGAQTSAGLEEALFMLDDTGERTPPSAGGADDADSLAETQESPTVETPYGAGDASNSASTMETPTVESPRADLGGGLDMGLDDDAGVDDDLDSFADTMESPTVESGAASETQAFAAADESPTVESYGSPRNGPDAEAETPTVETPMVESAFDTPGDTVEQPRPERENASEFTAELDLDDLGLDVEDLGDLPQDLGDLPTATEAESDTREQPALEADDELLSATGVTQVLTADQVEDDDLEYSRTSILSDEDATMMAPRHAEDAASENTLTGTAVLEQPEAADDSPTGHGESGLDLDLDDLNAALGGDADTVEQPRANPFADAMFGGDSDTPVDLDIGSDYVDGDDPTGTEQYGLDPQTMTEVGTKLDLARAYIDMGDPEGARSILEEVLDEGDTGQKREAQSLIDVLAS